MIYVTSRWGISSPHELLYNQGMILCVKLDGFVFDNFIICVSRFRATQRQW